MERDWRCQKYGPLGWMETIVKVLAIGVGVASLSIYNNDSRVLQSTRIAEIVLMAVMGAAYLAFIAQRVLDKELFALAFIILQVIGHWLMTLITILSKDPGAFLFTYAFLMSLGEIIKILFLLLADNIEVRFFTKQILFGISIVTLLIYIAIIVIQIIIWLVQYDS